MDPAWSSASRWLFMAVGAIWLLIGALTPAFVNLHGNLGFLSKRTDRERYGPEPTDDARLKGVRESAILSLAGMLVVGGILVMAIAWFALPSGERWPFWSLVAAGAVAVPYWILVLRPYWAAGIRTTLADLPPFMWVTTVLWLLGTAAGLMGRRGP